MASSDAAMDGPSAFSGIRIRSKEDLNRVIAKIKKREEMLKVATKKLRMKEARLVESKKKLKDRNDFLDAWEVSLKAKESETMEERQELENLKASLRQIGQDLLALSDKTESAFEGVPYEDDIFEGLDIDEAPEEKKSMLGFLKGGKKKSRAKRPKEEAVARSSPGGQKKTLREILEAKREKLKSAPIDTSMPDSIGGGEEFACPNCGGEVSRGEVLCLICDTELTWD